MKLQSSQISQQGRVNAKPVCWALIAVLVVWGTPAALGSSALATHGVTISIPQANEISGDLQSFNLAFTDFLAGSETNQQVVNYHIKANSLGRDNGVVQVKVSVSVPGVAVKADAGVFSKQAGNARLVESNEGFVALGEEYTHLYDRQTDSGDGAVAVGDFSVIYKAATNEAMSAQNVHVELSIVVVDV